MVFKAAKDISTLILLWGSVAGSAILPLFVLTDEYFRFPDACIAVAVSVVFTAIPLWMLFDTKYTVRDGKLHYCSGFIRGSIAVDRIRKIGHVKGYFVSSLIKPALAGKGLTIYYDKYEDLYIAPKDKAAFISALLEMNPAIKVN